MAAATADVARLFFAAWPAPEVQRALGKIARDAQPECGGRAVPTGNIHLTLIFLGNLPRHRVTALETIASSVRGHPFALTVDRLEYWRHNRIVWGGTRACPEALQALVARLQEELYEIRGETDLVAETQNMHVRVVPSLGAGAATIVGILGGPLAAAGSLLAEKLLKDPLGQIFASEYSVTGTWTDPKVDRISAPSATGDSAPAEPSSAN